MIKTRHFSVVKTSATNSTSTNKTCSTAKKRSAPTKATSSSLVPKKKIKNEVLDENNYIYDLNYSCYEEDLLEGFDPSFFESQTTFFEPEEAAYEEPKQTGKTLGDYLGVKGGIILIIFFILYLKLFIF